MSDERTVLCGAEKVAKFFVFVFGRYQRNAIAIQTVWLRFNGSSGIFATRQQGATNQKARQILGWHPRYSNWHDGFQAMLAHTHEQPAELIR